MNEPGNGLGVGGAEALAPALARMVHMTTLNLECKSRRTYAPGGVCWLNRRKWMRESVRAWVLGRVGVSMAG